MKIKWIKIQNFKSIKNEITISNLKTINILIGLNGSGKSNILKAINFFCEKKENNYKDFANEELMNNSDIPIKIEFCIESIFQDKNKEIFKSFINECLSKYCPNFMYFNQSLWCQYVTLLNETLNCFNDKSEIIFKLERYNKKDNDESNIKYSLKLSSKKLVDLFNDNNNKLLSKINNSYEINKQNSTIEFFNFNSNIINKITNILFFDLNDLEFKKKYFSIYKKSNYQIDKMMNCFLLTVNIDIQTYKIRKYLISDIIFHKKQIENNMNNVIKKFWPEFSKNKKIGFEILNDSGYYKIIFFIYITEKNSNILQVEIDSALSSGERQFLYLTLLIGGAEMLNSSIILIDEPEIHLDYKYLSKLKEILEKIESNNNIFFMLSTHEEKLIDTKKLNQCFSVVNNNKITNQCVNIFDIKRENIPKILLKIFNFKFSSNSKILIVEGITDCLVYDWIFRWKNTKLFIIPCQGTSGLFNFIKWFLKFDNELANLKNRIYVLLDGDEAGQKAKQIFIGSSMISPNRVFSLDEILLDVENPTIESFLKQSLKQKEAHKNKKILERMINPEKNLKLDLVEIFYSKMKSFLDL